MTAPYSADDVNAADAARYDALIAQDADALSSLLADDLVYLHGTGAADTKQSFIDGIVGKKFQFRTAQRIDPVVRVFDSGAVLHGKIRMTVEVAGTLHEAYSTFSTVWIHRNGRWQLVHWQSTPLKA